MRHTWFVCSIGVLVGFLVMTSMISAPAGAQSRGGVLPADARALRYGASAPEILDNPAVRDKVRALFGADWQASPRLRVGAPTFFPASSALRMVRIGDQDYIAVSGCAASCATQRGLLLIRPDGEHLMARLDEGGFSHYYDYRTGAPTARVPEATIDHAWSAIEDVERG